MFQHADTTATHHTNIDTEQTAAQPVQYSPSCLLVVVLVISWLNQAQILYLSVEHNWKWHEDH